MKIIFTSQESLSRDLFPRILSDLDESGFSLLKLSGPSDEVFGDAITICGLLGLKLGMEGIAFNKIESRGSNDKLGAHVEGIFNPDGVFPYFALACLRPSEEGGGTRIFDGRLAADMVRQFPGLESIIIEYSSLAYPGATKAYRLVEGQGRGALRYRQKAPSNRIIEANGLAEDKIYEIVDEILEKCVVLEHSWTEGDLLVVNNSITLHDRLPFSGLREILRVRYGDARNYRVKY